jgi:hypothetical protein
MTAIRGDDGEASLEACVGKRSRVAAYRRRRRAVIASAALVQESAVPRSRQAQFEPCFVRLASTPVCGAAEPRTTQWAGCVVDPAS